MGVPAPCLWLYSYKRPGGKVTRGGWRRVTADGETPCARIDFHDTQANFHDQGRDRIRTGGSGLLAGARPGPTGKGLLVVALERLEAQSS